MILSPSNVQTVGREAAALPAFPPLPSLARPDDSAIAWAPTLPEVDRLIAGAIAGVETVAIAPHRDGIAELSRFLAQRAAAGRPVRWLHLVAHGKPGALALGRTTIDCGALGLHRSLLARWGDWLAADPAIAIYGCEFARGAGRHLALALERLTGARVFASAERVGHPDAGGSWTLRSVSPAVEPPAAPPLPIGSGALADYRHTLAIVPVTVAADSGPGSLRAAIAAAEPGDTIQFAPGLAGQTLRLTSGQLVVDKDLAIDGSNAPGLVVSGNNASRVFDLTRARATFTVRNFTIADGKTTQVGRDGAGAGIRTTLRTTLNVENVTFTNNEAAGRGGGAIYSHFQSTATVNNSRFLNNRGLARETASENYGEHAGGAITMWSDSALTVRNSLFEGNQGVNGGAINNLLSDLAIEDTVFRNNDSSSGGDRNSGFGGYGGGLYTDGAGTGTGEISLRNVRFEGNQGAGQGGGAFLNAYSSRGHRQILENVVFADNAVGWDRDGVSAGGGLRVSGVPATITNASFANNRAYNQGGGFWANDRSQVSLTNATFSGNRAELDAANPPPDPTRTYQPLGGAMFFAGGSGHRVDRLTVADNFAGFAAGAAYFANGAAVTASNSIFANNTADHPFGIKLQVNEPFLDGGNNVQWPDRGTTRSDDPNVTTAVAIDDPNLGALQETDGAPYRPLPEDGPYRAAGVGARPFSLPLDSGDPGGPGGPGDPDDDGDDGSGDPDPGDDAGDADDPGTGEGSGDPAPGDPAPSDPAPGDPIAGQCDRWPYPDRAALEAEVAPLRAATASATVAQNADFEGVYAAVLPGSDRGDRLQGSGQNEVLVGAGGNDLLLGGDGSPDRADRDLLRGGSGDDTLASQRGADVAFGDDGNDWLRLGREDDRGFGDLGDDVLYGDLGDDRLDGGDGNDTLQGGNGSPVPIGDRGERDLLLGGAGNDLLAGNEGRDTLAGEGDDDLLRGGKDEDLLFGDGGDDRLYGDIGDDSLCGGDGNDTLQGGNGSPIPVGFGRERDVLCGGDGNDLLLGNEGGDEVCGDGGDDSLYGGKDEDILDGGDGDDWLSGDLGNDTLDGGSGRDRFLLSADGGSDAIVDFQPGEDLLVLVGGLTPDRVAVEDGPNGAIVRLANGGAVLGTLQGTPAGELGPADLAAL